MEEKENIFITDGHIIFISMNFYISNYKIFCFCVCVCVIVMWCNFIKSVNDRLQRKKPKKQILIQQKASKAIIIITFSVQYTKKKMNSVIIKWSHKVPSLHFSCRRHTTPVTTSFSTFFLLVFFRFVPHFIAIKQTHSNAFFDAENAATYKIRFFFSSFPTSEWLLFANVI